MWGPRLICAQAGASALSTALDALVSQRKHSTLTILHCFRNLQHSKFPHCCADVAKVSGKKGSNVYEVNQSLPMVQIVALWEGQAYSGESVRV